MRCKRTRQDVRNCADHSCKHKCPHHMSSPAFLSRPPSDVRATMRSKPLRASCGSKLGRVVSSRGPRTCDLPVSMNLACETGARNLRIRNLTPRSLGERGKHAERASTAPGCGRMGTRSITQLLFRSKEKLVYHCRGYGATAARLSFLILPRHLQGRDD